eukprot:SAG31_NODE_4501_length_3183_cov_11.818742_1_plen_395_part_00
MAGVSTGRAAEDFFSRLDLAAEGFMAEGLRIAAATLRSGADEGAWEEATTHIAPIQLEVGGGTGAFCADAAGSEIPSRWNILIRQLETNRVSDEVRRATYDVLQAAVDYAGWASQQLQTRHSKGVTEREQLAIVSQLRADIMAERSARMAAEAACRKAVMECDSWRRLHRQITDSVGAARSQDSISAGEVRTTSNSVEVWLEKLLSDHGEDVFQTVFSVFTDLLGDDLDLEELGPTALDDSALAEVMVAIDDALAVDGFEGGRLVGYDIVALLRHELENMRYEMTETNGQILQEHTLWYIAPEPNSESQNEQDPPKWNTWLTGPSAVMVPIQRLCWAAMMHDRLWPQHLPTLTADLAEMVAAFARVADSEQTLDERTEIVRRFILQGWDWNTAV